MMNSVLSAITGTAQSSSSEEEQEETVIERARPFANAKVK